MKRFFMLSGMILLGGCVYNPSTGLWQPTNSNYAYPYPPGYGYYARYPYYGRPYYPPPVQGYYPAQAWPNQAPPQSYYSPQQPPQQGGYPAPPSDYQGYQTPPDGSQEPIQLMPGH